MNARRSRAWSMATFIVLCCTSVIASDIRAELEEIRNGYLANRSAFSHGMCRYTYTIASADSEADALQGKRNDRRPAISRESTLFFDGDAYTIKVAPDAAAVRRAIEEDQGLIVPITIACKGGYAIDHDGLINNAILHGPGSFRLTVRYHPYNLAADADTSPAKSIEYAASREFELADFRVERDVIRDGHAYVKLSLTADYNSREKICWIDPNRGYLPFVTEYVHHKTGEFAGRMFLLKVHEERGAFFPLHAIHVIPRRQQNGTSYSEVREMKVSQLDLSYQPTAEDLTIRLSKHTQYSDGINPNTAKSLFREGTAEYAPVSVNDIEGIFNQLQALAVERAKEDAQRRK